MPPQKTTNPPPEDDNAWLRNAAKNNAQDLLRYANSLTNNHERAQDAVQDTLLRLCKANRDDIEHKLRPWLFRVCRSRVIDLARKETRTMNTLDESGLEREPDHLPTPDRHTTTSDAAQHALQLLHTLPENQREVIRLKFQNGLSYKEIADITELTITNVGFLLHTALKTLRQKMTALDKPQNQST